MANGWFGGTVKGPRDPGRGPADPAWLEKLEERVLLSVVAKHVDLGMGTAPTSVIAADLNRDGVPDLVTANSLNDTISIRLGNGDGTFGVEVSYGMGYEPVSVIAADLNNDGKLDLVTANRDGDGDDISIRLGNGDGTFGAETRYDMGWPSVSVIAADLNRDGKLDLVTANNGAGTVSVRLGNGDGTFGATANYATGSAPTSVIAADLNHDGNLDVVTAGSLSVHLGNGDGTLGARFDYATGLAPSSVIAADMDGDGNLDLVTANYGANTLSIRRGKSDGTFLRKAKHRYKTGMGPSSVIAADLNGDGKLDLVTANELTDSVSILIGKKGGRAKLPKFKNRTAFATGDLPNSVIAADVDGDGKLDLVTANSDDDTVSVLLGNGDRTFQPNADYGTGTDPRSVFAADLNRDGNLDLVTANNSVSVLLGNGDGTFGANTDYAMGAGTRSAIAVDLDNDGDLDLVAVNNTDDTVSVRLGNGDGTFGAQVVYTTGTGPTAVAAGDLNRDGKLDLVVTNGDSTANSVSVLLGVGDGTFLAKTDYATSDRPSSVVIADLNRDGKLDLAVSGHTTSYNNVDFVSVHLGNGDGTFVVPRVDYNAGDEGIVALSVADVNRDGIPDLLTANNRMNSVSVLLGTSTAGFWNRTDFGTGVDPRSVIAADLNNDGWLELVTANGLLNTVSVLFSGK